MADLNHFVICMVPIHSQYITDKKGNIMDYEQLHSDITKLLVKTQKEMEKLIEEYNENNDAEIDTVDLDSKFDPVFDYVEDYITE